MDGSVLEAYVTNLGKYNEGVLACADLRFPTSPEAVQDVLKRIGIDGIRYEEIFIPSFDSNVSGLYQHLGEYENLDELNHLACLLSALDESQLEVFEAVLDKGDHTACAADLINLAQNLDCYDFHPGVDSAEALGRVYVEDMEALDVPEHLRNYIDYEAYGRDVSLEEDGYFSKYGYLIYTGGFVEQYHGIEDIPDEQRVFSMPKLPIREQLAAYKEIADRSAHQGDLRPASIGHDER